MYGDPNTIGNICIYRAFSNYQHSKNHNIISSGLASWCSPVQFSIAYCMRIYLHSVLANVICQQMIIRNAAVRNNFLHIFFFNLNFLSFSKSMELMSKNLKSLLQRSSDDGEKKISECVDGDDNLTVFCLLFIMLRSNNKCFHMGNYGLSYIGSRSSDNRTISADSHPIFGINMFASIKWNIDKVRTTVVLD